MDQEAYGVPYDGTEPAVASLLRGLKIFSGELIPGLVVRIMTYGNIVPDNQQAWCRTRKHTVLIVDPPMSQYVNNSQGNNFLPGLPAWLSEY